MELAQSPPGALLQTREIARRQDIPERYLPTIVRTLARSGLLRTLRGSKGGVSLARPSNSISLLDIVEAIDGPVLLNRCRIRPGECSRDVPCRLHSFWERLVEEIEAEMRAISLEHLAELE
jgi:Rrf2 family protein